MQSTYWLEKVLKMISLYVSALLCTLQHIVLHVMQLSGVNSQNCFRIDTAELHRYRALASIIPGRERPEETIICYKILLVQLINNLTFWGRNFTFKF